MSNEYEGARNSSFKIGNPTAMGCDAPTRVSLLTRGICMSKNRQLGGIIILASWSSLNLELR